MRHLATALDKEGTLDKRWHPSEVGRILKRKDYKLGPPGARIVDPKVWNAAQAVLAERRPSLCMMKGIEFYYHHRSDHPDPATRDDLGATATAWFSLE